MHPLVVVGIEICYTNGTNNTVAVIIVIIFVYKLSLDMGNPIPNLFISILVPTPSANTLPPPNLSTPPPNNPSAPHHPTLL